MNPIEYIIEMIDQIDNSTFKKYVITYIIITFTVLGSIYTIFYFKKNNSFKNFTLLQSKKKVIDSIVEQKSDSLKKKQLFDDLLNTKESFKLKDYIYSALQKSNFYKYLIINNEGISEQKLNQNYIEFSITIEFGNTSTEEALYILSILENDERVYIKQINIKNNNKKLFFNVTLATIQVIKT